MKVVVWTLVVLVILAVIAYFAVVYSGWIDVSAGEPAWMGDTLDKVMTISATHHAKEIAPVVIHDPQQLAEGFAEYHETCEKCHGGPGTDGAAFAKYMDPTPPEPDDLAGDNPSMIFWIAKHGIMMTGMPAFGKIDTDQKLWEVVNIIPKLPKMNPADYQKMVAEKGSAH